MKLLSIVKVFSQFATVIGEQNHEGKKKARRLRCGDIAEYQSVPSSGIKKEVSVCVESTDGS